MTLPDALGILRFCTCLAIGSLGGALIYAAFFGRLRLGGLLTDKQTGTFSTARLQLVGVTVVVALLYLRKVAIWPWWDVLPDFDETWLAALSAGGYGLAKLDGSLRVSTARTLIETIVGWQRRIT
jgi:hypothetical protein